MNYLIKYLTPNAKVVLFVDQQILSHPLIEPVFQNRQISALISKTKFPILQYLVQFYATG